MFNENRFVRWNSKWKDITGYSDEELAEKYGTDFFEGEDRVVIAEKMKQVFIRGHAESEANLILKDGRSVPYFWNGAKKRLDGKDYLIGMGVDITERRLAENALKAEMERSQQYLDIANVMFVVLDAQQNITMINRKGCEVLGYREDELIGKNWFDTCIRLDDSQAIKRLFRNMIFGGHEIEGYYENVVCSKTGAERIVGWHNAVIRDASGRIISILSSGEDITERKKAEVAVHEARQFMEMAIEQSSVGIVIADAPDCTIRIANTAALNIRGGDNRVLTGIDVSEHQEKWQIYRVDGTPYPPEELPLSLAVLKGVTTKGVELIVRDMTRKDHVVVTNASPIRDAGGKHNCRHSCFFGCIRTEESGGREKNA